MELLRHEAGSELSEASTTALTRLSEQLDRDLFAATPSYDQPLTERQIRFYKERLRHIVELALPRPDPDHLQISPKDRQRAAAQLEELAQNDDERRRWQATLSRYLKRRTELADLTAQIEELAVEDHDQRKRVADLTQQRDALRDELASVRADLEQIKARIKALEAEIVTADRALDEARRRAESTAAADRRATLARRVERLLADLVPMTFERRRRELEDRVNQRLSELLTSNTLIHRVSFTSNLDHRFLDRNGREIGTGSVSAGMKQLYAMAFLWALIDASQRTLPVVVDTPLSRLDQEHQERLLTHFFPRLAQQVILLPTNSELDRAKYALIRPHVYRQYRLEISPGGDETTQRELDMYPGAQP